MISVIGIDKITVWNFTVHAFTALCFRVFYGAYLLACIAGVKLVEPVPKRHKLVIFTRRIHSVIDSNEANSVFGKYDFYQLARLEIISAKT